MLSVPTIILLALGISFFVLDLVVIPLWTFYVYSYKRTLINNRFRGYAINAVLGLRCSAGPSLYSRRTPSRLVVGSLLFKMACVLTLTIMPENEEIATCAGCVCSFLISILYGLQTAPSVQAPSRARSCSLSGKCTSSARPSSSSPCERTSRKSPSTASPTRQRPSRTPQVVLSFSSRSILCPLSPRRDCQRAVDGGRAEGGGCQVSDHPHFSSLILRSCV